MVEENEFLQSICILNLIFYLPKYVDSSFLRRFVDSSYLSPFSGVVCEDRGAFIGCFVPNQVIQVIGATFGRTNSQSCPSPNSRNDDVTCSKDITRWVRVKKMRGWFGFARSLIYEAHLHHSSQLAHNVVSTFI